MLLPLLGYLSNYVVHKLVRFGARTAILVNIMTVVGSGSRGAMVGLAALVGVLILQSKNKFAMLGIVAVLGLGALSLTTSEWRERMGTVNSAETDGSFMGRVTSWKMNTVIALDRPLIGGGFSATTDPRVYAAYRSRFSDFNFFLDTGEPTGPLEAHSIYFQVLGDTGFVGFGLFIGLLVTGFANLRAVSKLAKGRPEFAWAGDLAAMLRLSMIAYCVSGALLSMAYFEMFYVVLTTISLLRECVAREVKAAPAAARPSRFAGQFIPQMVPPHGTAAGGAAGRLGGD